MTKKKNIVIDMIDRMILSLVYIDLMLLDKKNHQNYNRKVGKKYKQKIPEEIQKKISILLPHKKTCKSNEIVMSLFKLAIYF